MELAPQLIVTTAITCNLYCNGNRGNHNGTHGNRNGTRSNCNGTCGNRNGARQQPQWYHISLNIFSYQKLSFNTLKLHVKMIDLHYYHMNTTKSLKCTRSINNQVWTH